MTGGLSKGDGMIRNDETFMRGGAEAAGAPAEAPALSLDAVRTLARRVRLPGGSWPGTIRPSRQAMMGTRA